ncbi:two-component regulator propeller domain-containing protein [Sulfidibacter corallicola]|uniref:SpoIIE family protein phosphatase n=1 Tax=Sulfidibacter corallicola TaxID=2818388 RepID=A0A8A4TME7_SULCO|nr:two-component regulator propeller domain-containing protein [Sulfidibacter corallicola]QTD50637.1 SpoIIE family protein phosphatase [Sulfidibacter corallicola]
MNANRSISILLCAVAWSLPFLGPSLQAQTRPGLVSFKRLAIPDDVPVHLVSQMIQDRRGLLWLGTQDGLVRYDGYRFKVYRSRRNDPHSLGGSYIRALCLAGDGRLWIGSFGGGASVFDPRTDRFRRYQYQPQGGGGLSHNRVEGIAETPTGHIWLATHAGLDRLDLDRDQIDHFAHDPTDPDSLADDRVRGLLVDRSGRLWIGTRDGLQRWRPETADFERVASDPAVPDSLAGQYVVVIFEDSRGRIWIGTNEQGAAMYDPATRRFHRFPHDPSSPNGVNHYFVYSVVESRKGEIWIATFGGGIDVLDPDTLEVIDRLRSDPSDPATIGNDRIGALIVDHSGLVWVGSWGGGIAFHDPTTRPFVKLRHSLLNPIGPTHPSIVRTLALEDGTLWLGTNGNGIDVMDRERRLVDEYRADAEDPEALGDGSITCMIEATDGTRWVATLNGMLHRMASGEARFRRFDQNDGLPWGPIRTMVFDGEGHLWVGASEGMARIDPETYEMVRYAHRSDDPRSLSGQAVESLVFDRVGLLWAGTENGLNAFDPTEGTARRIFHDEQRPDSLPGNWVPDLLIDREDRLWVATQAGAAVLERWDGQRASFSMVHDLVGIEPRPVHTLIEDDEGFIWLGPRLRVNPRDWTHQTFGPAEGNDFHSFFIASRSKTPDGNLLFGSPQGVLLVDPRRLETWSFQPPLIINDIHAGGRDERGAIERGSLQIGPGRKTVRFEFSALDFSAPWKLQYRYRLEGFDDDWLQADASQRSVSYTSLPPGSYQLRVQGTNRAGSWSIREAGISLVVVPAFYQTTAFRIGLVLLLACLAYCGFRLRVQQLEARSRFLESVVALRTSELNIANRELADKNEKITAGIRYAQKIQHAILPHAEDMAHYPGAHFVIFRPKDLVSGDFYWIWETGPHLFVAVVDCTGHGVPGAFMSMIGYQLLNKIVGEKAVVEPAKILELLNIGVRESLHQNQRDTTRDGMELCLCRFEKGSDRVLFAGAGLPLFLVRPAFGDAAKGSVQKVRGDRHGIGGRQKENVRTYRQVELVLRQGDLLVLASDGFADQCDAAGKKFGSRRLKQLLEEVACLSTEEIEERIGAALEQHMGDSEQRDDITMVGLRF